MPVHVMLPPQSPVLQLPIPLVSNVQFVLAHTLPFQLVPTVRFCVEPARISKPVLSGPSPFCVAMAGHIVSSQLLVIIRETLAAYAAATRPEKRNRLLASDRMLKSSLLSAIQSVMENINILLYLTLQGRRKKRG